MSVDESLSQDEIVMITFLLTGIGGFGLFSVAHVVAPLRQWLVDVGILAESRSSELVVDFGDGQGLDVPRIVAAIAVVVIGIVVTVLAVRGARRRRRREEWEA